MANRKIRIIGPINWQFIVGFIIVVLIIGLITVVGIVIQNGGRFPEPAQSVATTPTESKAPTKSNSQALSELRSKINSLDPDGTIVSAVREGDSDAWTVIEVTSQWHYTPKGARLELAKVFQKAWASYTNNGDALIEIKDRSGNKVGGSTFLGDVYVED